jgi:hypothetical protein
MSITAMTKPRSVIIAAVVAVIFGGMTLFSGGSVLFIDGPARVAAGHYVPFVLWFNFVAGFAYISAGVGLFLWRGWGVSLAVLIAIATLLVFAGLGLHIWLGGDYEQRTLAAMTLRSTVWLVIAFTTRAAWKNGRKDR